MHARISGQRRLPMPRIPSHPESFGPRAASALALGVILLAGCGSPANDPKVANELVVALDNAPMNLDPRVGTDSASGRAFEVFLNGLVSKDPRGNVIPALAESWEVSEDGRRYRFHLRPDVVFHDGHQLTSADVVFTFSTILDGSVPTPKRGSLAQVEKIEAVDDLTVDFHLSESSGAILINFTEFMGIIPVGSASEEFNKNPIGTGPFQVVERGIDHVAFTAFDESWQGRPVIDRLVLRAIPDSTVRALELRKGSVQLLVNGLPPDLVADYRDNPEFEVIETPGSNYAYLGFNLETEYLGDAAVRRAIALGLDRQRLIDTLWQGLAVATETMMPEGHWARNEGIELIPYDPAGARTVLDEAGYTDPDGDGPEPRFRLTYKTSTDETAVLQAQVVQAMLAEVGIAIDIRSYEFATFYGDIKSGNFEMFSLRWMGVVDPDIYRLTLHSDSFPPNGANRGRYSNPEFDRLIDAGARELDSASRRPFYVDAQEILADELPYVSLYTKVNVAVYRAGLRGYENYLSGEFLSFGSLEWAR